MRTGEFELPPGDGEGALTALEAPLRGTFRLTVLEQGSTAIPGGRGTFGENADRDEGRARADLQEPLPATLTLIGLNR